MVEQKFGKHAQGEEPQTLKRLEEEESENSKLEKREGQRKRGRGLDCSCTVNNTPLGRDRLAHPYYPVTIYLLFVPHFRFVVTVAIGRECLPLWKEQTCSYRAPFPFIPPTFSTFAKSLK